MNPILSEEEQVFLAQLHQVCHWILEPSSLRSQSWLAHQPEQDLNLFKCGERWYAIGHWSSARAKHDRWYRFKRMPTMADIEEVMNQEVWRTHV